MPRGGCVVFWVYVSAAHGEDSDPQSWGILALPASESAKLKTAGESTVVSDPEARAPLAFLRRGSSPQDRVLRLSFERLSSALVTAAAAFWIPVFGLVALLTPPRRGYFPLARYGPIDLTTQCGLWPSLQRRARTSPKRRVTPPVAARSVAQLLTLTLLWTCRCRFRKTSPASFCLLRLSLSLPCSFAVLRCLSFFLFTGWCSPSPLA